MRLLGPVRRLGRVRPSPRRLSAALAVLGMLAGVACLVVPVEAAFADDPLFRLQPFSPALEAAATTVDCGAPVSNFGRRSDGVSLYALALDGACREAAAERAATGIAAAAIIGLLGLISLTAARNREVLA
ncbi:MAG: hypothetical protein ACRD1D_10965 [Acidimicrobiales bacterium]